MNAFRAPGPDADPPVTVLVVDDDELTRTGLRTLLSAKPDLDVVGEAGDGAEAVAAVTRLQPDVVLMDVRMPRVDGIEATRRLQALPDPPKVVVITTFEHDEYVWDALRAGASGFIRKRAPAQQIAHAVRLVTAGDSVLFPDAVRRMAADRHVRRDASVTAALTGRETETLRLMARGLSNQEIAAQLVVSLETVKTHVGNVLAKLGVGNRTQAVVLAFESGVAELGARTDPRQPLTQVMPG
ncbi:response regulator transcription factor [Streptomyces sp. WAC01526]|uniref:response regulator transcription factor n=1 Tax=Streptomyces sp. WAC01526 TaxID=2588709 RepID=UPI0011E01C94|nr:response regulator transcription factor [Streptomyces sp. WAC01526]MCW7983977.1 LuxR family transcriptional regulator [Streptomyces platensis subsp. clarensis]